MTSISNEPSRFVPERVSLSAQVFVPEMWACLAIVVMWLSVLVVAITGPDIVSSDGGHQSTVPAAVAVALFAFLGTWVVARYGFRRQPRND